MKRYPTGFVPANFQNVGKVIFIIGVLCIAAKLLSLLISSFVIPNVVLYFGIACIVVSGYLIFVVPREE